MRWVILDRDGVINQESDQYIKSPAEWQPIPGSLEAIARLNRARVKVAIATNQAGIARGIFDYDTLHAIHREMHQQLAAVGGHIDDLVFCPCLGDDCDCRKPKPGMLQDIARRTGANLSITPMVGDAQRDLDAAIAAGACPVLVRTGIGFKTQLSVASDIPVFDDLAGFVEDYLDRL